MKIKILLAGLIVASGIALTGLLLVRAQQAPPAQEQTAAPTPPPLPEPQTVRFTAEPDKTVLEQLASQAAIQTKSSQNGVYVDAINGHHGGEDGKYWTLYVNGQVAQVSAETFIPAGGEIIEWKFE